jgi:elongation factor 1-beta
LPRVREAGRTPPSNSKFKLSHVSELFTPSNPANYLLAYPIWGSWWLFCQYGFTNYSWCCRYNASQADVTIYKAVKDAPDANKYPYAARWYKNIHSQHANFETLPGDKSTDISKYGPETVAAAEEEDDVDLFGSDDEDDDAEKAALTAKRLEEYKAKKANKPKTSKIVLVSYWCVRWLIFFLVAKSVVTMDVKPWDDETNLDEMLALVKGIDKGKSSLAIYIGWRNGNALLITNLVVRWSCVGCSQLCGCRFRYQKASDQPCS